MFQKISKYISFIIVLSLCKLYVKTITDADAFQGIIIGRVFTLARHCKIILYKCYALILCFILKGTLLKAYQFFLKEHLF